MREWGLRLLRVAGLLCAFAGVARVEAAEYRLQVANMWESGFASFVRPGELGDGASGPGLERLVARLDRGELSKGPLLGDRTLRCASEAEARTYGAVRMLAEIKPGGEGNRQWDEVKAEGKPGERNVWVVSPSGRGRPQELYHVVLKGTGPVRHFIPYEPAGGRKIVTVRYPLEFLGFHDDRGDLWEKYLSRTLDLGNGIAVVVGSNSSSAAFPDQAYLVINQAAQETTYKAVLVWRDPGSNLETPRGPGRMTR